MPEHFTILIPMLSGICEIKFPQYLGFDKKVIVGIFCSASSWIRKDYTIDRINEIIERLKLNLEVDEDELYSTNYFKIKSK